MIRAALGLFWLIAGAALGASSVYEFRPVVTILTNIDEGTPLNHGQKSIFVSMPRGTKFSSFGQCYPQWQSEREDGALFWTTLTCDVEKWDDTLLGYRPSTDNDLAPAWAKVH